MTDLDRRDAKESLLTHKLVCSLFKYNAKTGKLTRKVSTSNKNSVGDIAGHLITSTGYRSVSVNNLNYPEHRIIWFIKTGYFPEHHVDHDNGIRDDNRWKNLFEVTRLCNSKNRKICKINKSGYVGVSVTHSGKYESYITVNYRRVRLGIYADVKHAAYIRFKYEVDCPDWNCDGQFSTYKAIKEMWPDFPYKKNGKLKKGRKRVVPVRSTKRGPVIVL